MVYHFNTQNMGTLFIQISCYTLNQYTLGLPVHHMYSGHMKPIASFSNAQWKHIFMQLNYIATHL